ncbi:MAG TPA: sulfotransferase, partial [Gammaproteobacteria bacterium]|nr:sulfotransferase [Gammaproteobacteria bacterium]
ADLIASQLPARVMFEPFNPQLVKAYAAFNYFQYMQPGEENPALLEVVQRVLNGRIRDPWIDREVDILRPQWRIIKEIRACLFLRWLHDHFPEVPILFIIRHPCAVVASRLQLGWATDGDLKPLLEQQSLLDDFLGNHLDRICSAKTDVEKHAILWCISNRVPLVQFRDIGLNTVYYEDLCNRPEKSIPAIFDSLGIAWSDTVYRHARRPSMTTARHSVLPGDPGHPSVWHRVLSAADIARVMAVVDEFGLGHLYGDADLPVRASATEGDNT